MEKLDPRLHAFRDDLADQRLKTQVQAMRFVEGKQQRICAPVAALFKYPDLESERQSECLYGEDVLVFEKGVYTSWVQSLKDGYVGYVDNAVLCSPQLEASYNGDHTHIVCVARTFQYSQADLRTHVEIALSMGSKVRVVGELETRGTVYAILDTGKAIIKNHLHAIDVVVADYVSAAEKLIYTPYLWGGVSGFGIDCSGLVQLSQMMAGKSVLRDTDMQQKTIGVELMENDLLQRGDLIFWKGHVAIMCDGDNIIHANGASMDVKVEPLDGAIERIAKFYQYPTAKRRPV